jgi:hypothetical protein
VAQKDFLCQIDPGRPVLPSPLPKEHRPSGFVTFDEVEVCEVIAHIVAHI